jgi:RNA polymerase primary sigma factor
LLDLIQEGNLGLLEAVKRYDWRRQLHFSTVAHWWIWKSITRAIADKARLIRMTADAQIVLRRIAAYQGLSAHDLENDEAIEEVARAIGISATAIRDLLASAHNEPLSLSSVVGEERETELGDLLVDESAEIPGVLSTTEELLQFLATILSPREMLILTRHYGLDDGPSDTLQAIGTQLHLSRERVRQVEESALDKLRDPAVAARLREMLEA